MDSKDKLKAIMEDKKSQITQISQSKFLLEFSLIEIDDGLELPISVHLPMFVEIETWLKMSRENPDCLQPQEIINMALQEEYGDDIPDDVDLGIRMFLESNNCVYLMGSDFGWIKKVRDIVQEMDMGEGWPQQYSQYGTDRCELLPLLQENIQQLPGRIDTLERLHRDLESFLEFWPTFPPVRPLIIVEKNIVLVGWTCMVQFWSQISLVAQIELRW